MKLKYVAGLIIVMLGAAFLFAADSQKLVRVEPQKVCMVNDKASDKDQIPVKVEDRTYYGCCEMCKKALTEKAELRFATDPVSGKKVDKAKAVIGARPDGTTVYFENEENLKKYQGN